MMRNPFARLDDALLVGFQQIADAVYAKTKGGCGPLGLANLSAFTPVLIIAVLGLYILSVDPSFEASIVIESVRNTALAPVILLMCTLLQKKGWWGCIFEEAWARMVLWVAVVVGYAPEGVHSFEALQGMSILSWAYLTACKTVPKPPI